MAQLLEAATTVTGADGAALLTQRRAGPPGPALTSDEAALLFQRIQAELGEGPSLVAAARGVPVTVPDLTADTRWDRLASAARRVGIRAVASVPVRLGTIVSGSLSAHSSAPREWAPAEVSNLQSLARLAGSLVDTVRRLDESRVEVGQLHHALDSRVVIEQAKGVLMAREGLEPDVAFERLRRRARNAGRRVGDVAAEIVAAARDAPPPRRAHLGDTVTLRRLLELERATARPPGPVARALVGHGVESVGAQAGLLALIAADHRTLEVVASSGYSAQAIAPWRRIPLEVSVPLVDAARDGTDSWMPTRAAFQSRYPGVRLMDKYQGRAAVGLVVAGEPVGALGLSFSRPQAFGGVDRRLIRSLAARCARALEEEIPLAR